MDKIEYELTQQQLLMVASLMDNLPLAEMRNQIGHADSIGPILYPTLYQAAGRRMQLIDDLVAAGIQVQIALHKLRIEAPIATDEERLR